jgi:hypothetical protein
MEKADVRHLIISRESARTDISSVAKRQNAYENEWKTRKMSYVVNKRN